MECGEFTLPPGHSGTETPPPTNCQDPCPRLPRTLWGVATFSFLQTGRSFDVWTFLPPDCQDYLSVDFLSRQSGSSEAWTALPLDCLCPRGLGLSRRYGSLSGVSPLYQCHYYSVDTFRSASLRPISVTSQPHHSPKRLLEI